MYLVSLLFKPPCDVVVATNSWMSSRLTEQKKKQVWLHVATEQMEVWWSSEKVKLASEVLWVLISNQNQFKNLSLQDEQNIEWSMD